MAALSPGGLYAGAVACLALCAVAGRLAFDAYRFGERRRMWIWLAVAPTAAAAAATILIFAINNPGRDVWGGAAFGPGWECANAPRSGQTCFKDVPAALDQPQAEPLKQESAP